MASTKPVPTPAAGPSENAPAAASHGNGAAHGRQRTSPWPMLQKGLQLMLCVAGIYSAYLTQGMVNEHLAIQRYGPQQERFQHLEALNGAQAVVGFALAWLILQLFYATGRAQRSDDPHWTAYWKSGISNSVGPACGMFALRNITYSAQVLAKSCKMVPVMLMGTLLHGKAYAAAEYACMSLIGVGVALFARKGSAKAALKSMILGLDGRLSLHEFHHVHAPEQVTSKLASPNMALGYGLCLVNLGLDGYTNAAQDQVHHLHPRSSPLHMMAWMNFWTAAYYCAYLFALTPNGGDILRFCWLHQDAARDVVLFCLCGAYGQLFIFYTIKTFGSLVNTLICTTRKFFNILISVVWNGNALLPIQWVAVAMVFTGLIASTLQKSVKKRPVKQKTT